MLVLNLNFNLFGEEQTIFIYNVQYCRVTLEDRISKKMDFLVVTIRKRLGEIV